MQFKIMIVVGARPNFVKAAPIITALEGYNESRKPTPTNRTAAPVEYVLVHTGQHYDGQMSGRFFEDLGLPLPNVNLGVGSGSHAAQTAEIMKRFEPVVVQERPDAIIVVGDVNSTLACSLVAAKTALKATGNRPLIVHVEAGLRSFDRSMPEECNRVVTDHLADMLFVTEKSGVINLVKEGISLDRICFVGNTMVDSLLASKEKAKGSSILERLGLRSATNGNGAGTRLEPYALLTLHRPSNVDDREVFVDILEGLEGLVAKYPVIFPGHPRTVERIKQFSLGEYFTDTGFAPDKGSSLGIHLIHPLGYLDFICLMMHAKLVVTDSGGIQEETTCLGVPCVTVRNNTERPVTVACGTNVVAGTRRKSIQKAVGNQMKGRASNRIPDKWDGRAAARIVEAVALELQKRNSAAHFRVKSPCHVSAGDARATLGMIRHRRPAGKPLEL